MFTCERTELGAWWGRTTAGVAMLGAIVLAAVMMAAVGMSVAAAANTDDHTALNCTRNLGDPVPGTVEWDEADLNNQQCAAEGLRIIQSNPAIAAARDSNTAAGQGHFLGDPFRAPHRWSGKRGSYQLTTYTESNGRKWSAALFGPLDADDGPYPGVLLVCHACPLYPTPEYLSSWYWAAEALAEAGYIVMHAAVPGNNIPATIDATDFFVATAAAPTPHGDFNPWHARLDRKRLAIVGHSGAGGVALNVGHTDPRYDAVVAFDPAGPSLAGLTLLTPTMIQVADYGQTGAVPRPEKPTPEPGSRYTYFDTIRAAGVDVMQVALRASTHNDWSRIPSNPARPHSLYGEMVGIYYTVAWLDRYLTPSWVPGKPWPHAKHRSVLAQLGACPSSGHRSEGESTASYFHRSFEAHSLSYVTPVYNVGIDEKSRCGSSAVAHLITWHYSDRLLAKAQALDALRRLTASGTDRFDRSADVYSIGAGFFDAGKAERAGNVEAGNVPLKIKGLRIRNLLSFHYDSKYFLEGGALQCEDMRAECRPPWVGPHVFQH